MRNAHYGSRHLRCCFRLRRVPPRTSTTRRSRRSSSPRIKCGHRRRQARARRLTPDVKKFAQLMIDESHGREQVGPPTWSPGRKSRLRNNPTSQSLKSGGESNLANLKTLKGAAFDKAYIDHEVAYHQQVLDAVDKTLIPGAKNEELKALLVKVRPAFVGHLEHARALRSTVGRGTGACEVTRRRLIRFVLGSGARACHGAVHHRTRVAAARKPARRTTVTVDGSRFEPGKRSRW